MVTQAPAVQFRIGLLGQHAALDEQLGGRQNLEMFARLHHLGARRARERADELLLLFRFAMLWIGIQLALVAGKPELVQAVQILVWPVGFLSNAFAAPEAMPGWLGTAVQWNPMSQTATAVRDLFGGPGGEPGHVWAAVAWPLALLAVFLPLAVRRFGRLSA